MTDGKRKKQVIQYPLYITRCPRAGEKKKDTPVIRLRKPSSRWRTDVSVAMEIQKQWRKLGLAQRPAAVVRTGDFGKTGQDYRAFADLAMKNPLDNFFVCESSR